MLDLAFVRKNEDWNPLAGLRSRTSTATASSDLIGFEGSGVGSARPDDYNEAGAALEPGASAAILLYENRWARPFAAAVRRSGAQLVASGRIPHDDLADAVENLESTSA